MGATIEMSNREELLQRRGLYYQINTQQKHGSDLLPPTSREPPLVCGLLSVGLMAANQTGCCMHDSHRLNQYTRESR